VEWGKRQEKGPDASANGMGGEEQLEKARGLGISTEESTNRATGKKKKGREIRENAARQKDHEMYGKSGRKTV